MARSLFNEMDIYGQADVAGKSISIRGIKDEPHAWIFDSNEVCIGAIAYLNSSAPSVAMLDRLPEDEQTEYSRIALEILGERGKWIG